MSLKNCPFCGGAATMIRHAGLSVSVRCMSDECKIPSVGINYCDESEVAAAWNTRAAPTMKPWVWRESEYHVPGTTFICRVFMSAQVTSLSNGQWKAFIDGRSIGYHASKELAQAACVAYVEGKLKEWLVL